MGIVSPTLLICVPRGFWIAPFDMVPKVENLDTTLSSTGKLKFNQQS